MAGTCKWNTDRLVRLAGPRTVPVELGDKYTDHSWTQKLMIIDEFVEKHMKSTEGSDRISCSAPAYGTGSSPHGGHRDPRLLLHWRPRGRRCECVDRTSGDRLATPH